jgi:uncharacterized protein (DUF305 family)
MKRYSLLALVFTSALSLPVYAAEMPAKDAGMGVEKQLGVQGAPFDQQFIDTMLYHYEISMQMAELALSQATSPGLQERVGVMLDLQYSRAQQLQDLREQLYGADAAKAINMKMHGMQALKNVDVNALQAVDGETFDLKFIRMMIEHHKGGVAMAMTELSKGKEPEVKKLAQTIMQSQAGNVAELRRIKQGLGATKAALNQ